MSCSLDSITFYARQSAENVSRGTNITSLFPWEPFVVLLSDDGLVRLRRQKNYIMKD